MAYCSAAEILDGAFAAGWRSEVSVADVQIEVAAVAGPGSVELEKARLDSIAVGRHLAAVLVTWRCGLVDCP